MISTVLGLESSCDETSAAVVKDGKKLLSNVVSSQISTHKLYGGVVPEIASRKHVEVFIPVINEALSMAEINLGDIDGIAVTHGPGLIGALLVGLSTAKSLSFSLEKPLIGINHLEAHITAIHLEYNVEFPFIALIVSGGHTNLYNVKSYTEFELIGKTRDDAAGEAFDKAAKTLDLGYPGGIEIDRIAREGDPTKVDFPIPFKSNKSFDFSFSGIKTSLIYHLRKNPIRNQQDLKDLCASYQESIVESLLFKTEAAAKHFEVKTVVISGGVACNSRLRELSKQTLGNNGIKVFIPSIELCTDNAAMVAALGFYRFKTGEFSDLDISSFSTSRPKIIRGKTKFKKNFKNSI